MIRILELGDSFVLYNNEKAAARCNYSDDGEIKDVVLLADCADNLLKALLLAVLSKLEKNGVSEAFSSAADCRPLLVSVGFSERKDGIYRLCLDGYFDNCRCCGQN